MTPALRFAAITLVAIGLAGCGKGKDAPKTADHQRAEREAFEKKREERAMQNPDEVFAKALKTQERAAKRAEAHRNKVVDEAQKRDEEGNKNEARTK